MNIIVSSHIDTVFRCPFLRWKDGVLRGALDNFGSMLATSLLMNSMGSDVVVEWTEDEEITMDGARQLARKHNNKDTLFIVLDVTAQAKGHQFTIENVHRVKIKEIRKALLPLRNQYRILPLGTESEAWLYKDMGYATIEVDLPVRGGLHSLDGQTDFEKVKTQAQAVEFLVRYFKDKTLAEIEEPT